VDCGITAVEEVEYAKSLGMDIVITDHHECREILPAAAAVINPRRKDSEYPFPYLAGVGVALKLVLALGGEEKRERLLCQYADLAAIGTVADVMLLLGENRSLVCKGLSELNFSCSRPGLRALLRETGCEGRQMCASTIGYILAPRLNASGRMGCASLAAELLLTEDAARSAELAKILCALNRDRQTVEGEIFEVCTEMLEREEPRSRRVVVMAGEGWHKGVVGIVASRLAEKYACPAFMICLQDGSGKGSCRSYAGFNLYEALEQCADLLESFGGHALAAGFTIREENIPEFRARLENWINLCTDGAGMESVLELDAEVEDPALLDLPNVEALSMLEPYGAGNPKPVFFLSGASVSCIGTVGSGRHMKLKLCKDGRTMDAIFFSAGCRQPEFSIGDKVDVAFYPQINEFRGNRVVQLQVADLRPAPTRAQTEQALYEKLQRGERLSPRQAKTLLPTREEFAGIWRYLKGHAAENRLEETICRLTHCIARTYGLRGTVTRTRMCLEVLEECGLIELQCKSDHVQILMLDAEKKVDLEKSRVMRSLREMTAQ
jgi:single-stranded-DNA-specific exonuclease